MSSTEDALLQSSRLLTAALCAWPTPLRSLQALVLLGDIILDRSVPTVATNGLDLLVNPDALPGLSLRQIQVALLAATLDGVFLHACGPGGVTPLAWHWRTAARTRRTLHRLGLTDDAGVTWEDRLRPPPPSLDLAERWGRRRCLARAMYPSPDERLLALVDLAPQGTCLACAAGAHSPAVPSEFSAIVRGIRQIPPRLPSYAEECFGLVWALTSPALSSEQLARGLVWLKRCGSAVWLQVAQARLQPVLEHQGRESAVTAHFCALGGCL